MKITSITAGWSETISLGNYNNVKPSLTLTAALEDGDDPALVRDQLIADCRTAVRDEIDLTLELHGQAPLYYTGPLFQVRYIRQAEVVFICLDEESDLPAGSSTVVMSNGSRAAHLRLERAQNLADTLASKMTFKLFDCTDGDFLAVEARREELETKRRAAMSVAVIHGDAEPDSGPEMYEPAFENDDDDDDPDF